MRRLAALAAAAILALACASRPRAPAVSTRPAGAAPDGWWKDAVFYEVFVRSFKDSNGDGKGDLAGLVEKLDYLNDGDPATDTDLGVDALWLMPIFESPSYHGYDVKSYDRIDKDYGTSEDFDRLVAQAHRRGIRVVIDLVLNHTSEQHPWFSESARSPASPRRDWYVWSPTDPGWTQPWNRDQTTWYQRGDAWYYALFWSGMPDLNYRTPAVREESKRIARAWLARGVDGFRLDAVRHLVETGPGPGQSGSPETHAFLKEFARAVREAKPDAVLVGEVWSNTLDIADYYGTGGDELQLLFDFPLATAIVEGVQAGDASRIADVLAEVIRTYPRGAVDAPFLTNHDQIRIATQLGNDPAKLRLAAAILLTLPGTPFVYYGEEIGMQNGPGREDEQKRTPMAWDATPSGGFTAADEAWFSFAPGKETSNVAAETRDRGSLLSRYRALIRARKAARALARGDLTMVRSDRGVLAYLRRRPGETVLVAHNLSGEPARIGPLASPETLAEPLLVDAGGALVRDGFTWAGQVPARGSGIWRLH
ncbi:MAG TPA: alpha-amylase family glycosyl hydrolase [Anaeromyxobacter sp.]